MAEYFKETSELVLSKNEIDDLDCYGYIDSISVCWKEVKPEYGTRCKVKGTNLIVALKPVQDFWRRQFEGSCVIFDNQAIFGTDVVPIGRKASGISIYRIEQRKSLLPKGK